MKIISGNPFLKEENGKILVDLIPLDDFLKKFQTPILIFLENKIRNNVNSFVDVVSSIFENFQCFYSLKANYLPEICKIICSEGIGAEIIGLPELKIALKAGFSTNKILVGGPYLPDKLIEMSIKNKVREIIIYNINDLNRINLIAQKYNRVQNVCIRINSKKYNSNLGVLLNEKNLARLKSKNNKCNNISFTTILSHYTSQMNNIEQFKKNIKSIATDLKNLKKIGINIENINLGGGFPEANVMHYNQLKKIVLEIKTTIEELGIDYKLIYFEPGRYFVGDTGLFLTEIIKVSENRWVFLNIGNHICPKFARCSLRFYNASQINNPHKYKTSFAGIVPTDQDVLAKDYFFTQNLKEGDKILVTNVGAYILTFSNRFPYSLPKIFLVKDNNFKLIFNPSVDKDFSIN
ncbi:MAG: diaminopimelate decarboxylase family protein [Promethearchaeota archaeon]